MHNAIERARALGFDTVQVFVKNQRQWACSPLKPEAIAAWKGALAPGFGPPIAHATYLINLAADNENFYSKSVEAYAIELQRCDQLAIPYLVVHPGAAGAASLDAAIQRVADALNAILTALPKLNVMPLLECTAGQGSSLGSRFDELGEIIRRLSQPQRIGVCLDTCHVFAAGYDIRNARQYQAMLVEADREVGLHRVRCWHLNDSRTPLGSRVDRHAHIGKGHIGPAGFQNLLHDRRFLNVPMILETPHEQDESGRDTLQIDLETLQSLEKLA